MGSICSKQKKSGYDKDQIKILLLGTGFCGKSTAFYQVNKIREEKEGTGNETKSYLVDLIVKVRFCSFEVATQLYQIFGTQTKMGKILSKLEKEIKDFGYFRDKSSRNGLNDHVLPLFQDIIKFYEELQRDNKLTQSQLSKLDFYYDGMEQ